MNNPFIGKNLTYKAYFREVKIYSVITNSTNNVNTINNNNSSINKSSANINNSSNS